MEKQFGQIPINLICRFGELTKTEIIVLTYLYASRNQHTKQCNPSRKAISADTGIHKSHLSPAVKSLEEKGWLVESEVGDFQLLTPTEKVTESVTPQVTETVTIEPQEVTKSVTEVTESVTKVTKSATPLNKDIEHKKNIKGTEEEVSPSEEVFVFWKETFNKNGSTFFTSERKKAVEARIKEGYSIDQLKTAILGCSITPHNIGKNDTGTLYTDLELICRRGNQVERFIGNYERDQEGLITNGNGIVKTNAATNSGDRNDGRIRERREIVSSLLAAGSEKSDVPG